jgi:cation:H+ antiporter
MVIPFLAMITGLVALIWSADRFVDGAAVTARRFSIPPLVIGIVVIGFGTSAPEMVVSAIASAEGNPGIALGNAYGSNITNIALILGVTALISPIVVDSQILRKTLPILTLVTLLAAWQLFDDHISRLDAIVLLLVFGVVMIWTVRQGRQDQSGPAGHDASSSDIMPDLDSKSLPLRSAVFWMIVGLLILIASSRLLVWGAVETAQSFGVSDLIIGLTVIAAGTSMPELASSVMAARKGEHDMALGNILGSNLFNTLVVVGIAGVIHPMSVGHEVLTRDMSVMVALTVSLFAIGYGFGGRGLINRWEGLVLLSAYVAYTLWLIRSVFVPV